MVVVNVTNVTVLELHPVNVTCSVDDAHLVVTYKWTSRSHRGFEQTGQNLFIGKATEDVAGDYECIAETDSRERKWAPMHLSVLCKCLYNYCDNIIRIMAEQWRSVALNRFNFH